MRLKKLYEMDALPYSIDKREEKQRIEINYDVCFNSMKNNKNFINYSPAHEKLHER
jgi:glutaredoxin-related protein